MHITVKIKKVVPETELNISFGFFSLCMVDFRDIFRFFFSLLFQSVLGVATQCLESEEELINTIKAL